MDHGTKLIIIPQQDCPALLVSATHKESDLLSAATLKNIGSSPLTPIGWVGSSYFPPAKTRFIWVFRSRFLRGSRPVLPAIHRHRQVENLKCVKELGKRSIDLLNKGPKVKEINPEGNWFNFWS